MVTRRKKMNKQELITRVEMLLQYYNKQYDKARDAQADTAKNNNKVGNAYACGRLDQLVVVLEDFEQLLEEVKSLEVDKERKLVKVVKYYE